MEVLIDYAGDKQYKTINNPNFETIIDAKKIHGGQEMGNNPMELFLTSIATCSGMDVVSTLEKMHIEFDKLQIFISGERAEEIPRVFTDINLTYYFWGKNLNRKKLLRAIDLVLDKYCPISVMTKQVANLNYILEINSDKKV